jgi:hypothetical protein
MLQILDQRWKEHLANGPSAPGHSPARVRPEATEAGVQTRSVRTFQELLYVIKRCGLLSRVQIERPETVEETERLRREEQAKRMRFTSDAAPRRMRRRRRSRRADRAEGGNVRPPRAESGSQRSVSVRLREEVRIATGGPADGGQFAAAGKLASIRGIRIGTANAGIKQTQRDDLVVMSLRPEAAHPVYSRRVPSAAPVRVCEGICAPRRARFSEQRQRKRRNRFRGRDDALSAVVGSPKR